MGEVKLDTGTLLQQLRTELPHIADKARVIGSWVWIEFSVAPNLETRRALKALGFHWNARRKCWQNPCLPSLSACVLNEQKQAEIPLVGSQTSNLNSEEKGAAIYANEFKVICLRECPLPEEMRLCDTPEKTAEYWRLHVATNPYFNPDCECFVVLILNTRCRVKGHQLVSFGTMDNLLVHPREVFRGALIAGAAKIVLAHNHPSGEADPSEADIRVTRELIKAGQLLRIEVLDHVVIGNQRHKSLKEMGLFYQ